MAAGWTSSTGSGTAQWYRDFGTREVHGVSAMYESLCLHIADDVEIVEHLDRLPEPKRQPNLLFGSVRLLGGPIGDWAGFREFVLDRWDDVSTAMRERRTQTNEARRCATLLPVLARLPQPLAIFEVGASAGLCLFPDRWSYRFDTPDGAHRVGDGPELTCATTGAVPLPESLPEVVWRGGLDLNPLDVTDDDDVRWLEALIWPEERERFGILREAVAIARADPPTIVPGDLTADLATAVADAPADATLVVFHTAVLAYVDERGRTAFADAVTELGRHRPTVWLANEAPGVVVDVEGGRPSAFLLARDGALVAVTGGHGDTLDWIGNGPS